MKRVRRQSHPKPHKDRTTAALTQGPRHRIWPATLAAMLVAVAAMVAHQPAYKAKALCFDDNQYLGDNMLVKNPSLEAAERFFAEVMRPSTVRGYYQPLSMVSLMLDYRMGGRENDPRIFHAVSMGLHAANSALVVLLLYVLFGSAPAAGLVGLLFAVHPMSVDVVAWISERKTPLATFFALASLVCYVRHGQATATKSSVSAASAQRPLPGPVFSPWLLASLVLYLVALLAKPTAVMLPAAMLLLDIWPLRRFSARAAVEKIPLVPIVLISCYVTFFSQKNTANLFTPDQNTAAKVLTVFYNVVFYPLKILYPAGLTAHYPFPDPMDLTNPIVLAGILGTLILALALWFSWRRTRAAAVGFGIFFVLLSPTMGIVGFNNVPACNKFAYLPLIGFLAPLAALAAWLWRRGGQRPWPGRLAIIAVVAGLAAGEMAVTRQYLSWWRDTETLYRHMLSLAPHATYVREDLANALSRAGKYDEAIECYRAAVQEREPTHRSQSRLNYNLALTLSFRDKPGDIDAAIEHARRAVQQNPENARWHSGLGSLLRRQNRLDEAIVEFNRSIALNGEWYEAHCNLGLALIDQRRWEEAIAACRRAVQLYPDYALGHLGLGAALVGAGQADAGAGELALAAELARQTGQRDIEQLARQRLTDLRPPAPPAPPAGGAR
jgi:tetratricopeptide (TPR) repeat protein